VEVQHGRATVNQPHKGLVGPAGCCLGPVGLMRPGVSGRARSGRVDGASTRYQAGRWSIDPVPGAGRDVTGGGRVGRVRHPGWRLSAETGPLQDAQESSNFFERRASAYQVGVTGDVSFDQAF
jgi:hypothetical protein